MDAALGHIGQYLVGLIFIIPALTLHEWAHAWTAHKMGDDTARMMGRLSLNPLRHLDPMGTVLIPMALLVFSGGRFTFGYAKPVPINPRNFTDYRKGLLLTGIAGPAMNVVLALASGLLVRVMAFLFPLIFAGVASTALSAQIINVVFGAINQFCYLNLVLCFFNLIPIPPLDGSRVLQRFLTGGARRFYDNLERYGFTLVIALVWILPLLLPLDPLAIYFRYTAGLLHSLLTGSPLF